MYHYSDRGIKLAEVAIVTTLLCLFQVLPILVLTFIKPKWVKLLLIVIMIGLMTGLNVLFADVARNSNFAGVAAYVIL